MNTEVGTNTKYYAYEAAVTDTLKNLNDNEMKALVEKMKRNASAEFIKDLGYFLDINFESF